MVQDRHIGGDSAVLAVGRKIRKHEAKVGDVEVDIYTPFQQNLVIPVSSLFKKNWYTDIEGHDVALQEILLLLKSQAAKERWAGEKGVKNRVDLLGSHSTLTENFSGSLQGQ